MNKKKMKILSIGLVLCFVGVSIVVVSADQTVTVDSEEYLLFDMRTSAAAEQMSPDYSISYLGESTLSTDSNDLNDIIIGITPVGIIETCIPFPTCKVTCFDTCEDNPGATCHQTCKRTCWTCDAPPVCGKTSLVYETCNNICSDFPSK